MEERIDPPVTTVAGREAVRVEGVSKSFPGVQALKQVDSSLREGEVHGLVGENGAGKSTLIKVLTGAYTADSGRVEIFGEPVDQHGPRAQQRAGVAAIYQELTVIAEMTAASNVFLGRPMRRGPLVRRRAMERRFRELCARLGVDIQPGARAGDLSVANQQMLEIMRALQADHRILIMDEPTASLGPNERERLHETVGRLRDEHAAVIYISHDLDEVLSLCDRVSVMRDGELVASAEVGAWDKEKLVDAMLGTELRAPPARLGGAAGEELLRVDGVSVLGKLEDISFVLRAGEIFGIAGLVGSGRTELLRALAGTQPGASGTLVIDGRTQALPRTVGRALALGIALAPEDRKGQGLVLSQNGFVNVTMTDMRGLAPGAIVRSGRRKAAAETIVQSLAFDPRRLGAPTGTLSGGNQQKLVVAKWLHRRPRVLLMDEPTRGIDVGAKGEMFAVMRRLADEGMAIVMVSSELEEVVDLADRVLVLARGRQAAILDHDEISLERVLTMTFGLEGEAAA